MSPKPPVRPSGQHPDRHGAEPDRIDRGAPFDEALARWAGRPPRTPAPVAARRIVSRLPAHRLGTRLAISLGRLRPRPAPWLAWAAAALVALGLGLALTSPLLRPGPQAARPADAVARAVAPGATTQAPGAHDDLLVIDLDDRTTLYFDLGGESGKGLGRDLDGARPGA